MILGLTAAGQPVSAQITPSTGTTGVAFQTPPAYVVFNHEFLFQVQSDGNTDAQDRADLANYRLQQAWSANQVHGIESNPTDEVVTAVDGPEVVVNGITIIHVAETDSLASGIPDDQLAQKWQQTIDHSFKREIEEKSPQYVHKEIINTVVDIILGLSTLIIVIYVGMRLKVRRLWSIYLAIAFYVLHLVANIFPNIRTIFFDAWTGPFRPLLIAVYVAVPAGALARIWAVILHSLLPPLPEHVSSQDLIRRTNLRRRTLAGVAEVTGISLIWIFAIVTAMSWWGFNPSSLLTSAGLIGVAIGLVAQDTIRDILAGIYIYVDDRYGVGDTIKVGEYEGRVERFNLRMTQIRDMSGRLITLSNRNTTEVANLTARWAQVDFRVGVSYYDDLDHALSVLETAATSLAEETPERFLDKPEIVGVESFNDLNITLRLIVRTPPGDQSVVAHELRKRVKIAFDKEGIAIINDMHKALKPE